MDYKDYIRAEGDFHKEREKGPIRQKSDRRNSVRTRRVVGRIYGRRERET